MFGLTKRLGMKMSGNSLIYWTNTIQRKKLKISRYLNEEWSIRQYYENGKQAQKQNGI